MDLKLMAAYEEYRENIRLPEALLQRASAPLLLKSTTAWDSATRRVLIVGQETNGWNSVDRTITTLQHFRDRNDGVTIMQDAYQAFALGENYRFKNSAFWRAFRMLTVNAAGLWTNLFRADVNGPVLLNCSCDEQRLLINEQSGLLHREIVALEPTAIVFLTGPRYDPALRAAFDSVSFRPLWVDVPEKCAALVSIPSLSTPIIRLYHPTYLQRSRRWAFVSRAGQWLAANS